MVEAARFRLGFIGFGEAATSIASGLAEAGFDGMAAFDIAAREEPHRSRLMEKAAAIGVTLLDDVKQIRDADVIFTLVQPGASLRAAEAAAPHIAPDATYVDLTSLGPKQKAAVGDFIARSGLHFVDGAILGSAPTSRHRVPIVAAGRRAADLARRFAPFGMDITPVGEKPGGAAGIKIVRSVLAKGLEALYVEALVAARRVGVEQEVLRSFCEFLDARPAYDTASLLVRSHIPHAGRRADEMRMSLESVAETGLAPVMTEAVLRLLERTAASGVAERFHHEQPSDFAGAVAALDEALGRDNHS
ncbi:MAG: NAD(P)-dependent oxidoreductase [Rhizobiales bacterium]|nr:NAD(P)-dependent oxidoreductase [Hyphomicrobiales bacterium]